VKLNKAVKDHHLPTNYLNYLTKEVVSFNYYILNIDKVIVKKDIHINKSKLKTVNNSFQNYETKMTMKPPKVFEKKKRSLDHILEEKRRSISRSPLNKKVKKSIQEKRLSL
jgi:hypothetical protein